MTSPSAQPLPSRDRDAGDSPAGNTRDGLSDEELDAAECAFFFDVDGTLLDIAERPEGVHVPAALVSDLHALHRRAGGALALVSGRPVRELDTLFAPLRLPAAGVHGIELRPDTGAEIDVRAPRIDDGLRTAIGAVTNRWRGVFAEDKGVGLAVHYRAEPDAGPALKHALADIVAGRDDLAILPGHMVFEIKPSGHHKGGAVEALMKRPPFAGRFPVFFGDDVTDEDGFAAALAAGGTAFAVGRSFPGARTSLSDAAAVRRLVHRLAQAQPAERRI
ncbi:trehalose 6-phosphatase [Pseudoxanthobacter soli DSM 19599]|uniref:Trehalose 6-phosphate phosphatase n=1 Tax=Pseudoxanthobacter soli DSM 19599 TaxID=1123029 RepID=A0A1M7ZQK8_9HYPH|nr:trehalose 6-phosphatase [Pseudoxanthobacter soli DSM 19599]